MPDFMKLKQAISDQFDFMSKFNLFTVDVDKHELWDRYLSSFPEGSNPLFRERTQHDCSCCRHFIYTMGGVVCIRENKLISIWDFNVTDPAYQSVANALSFFCKTKPIKDVFLHDSYSVGIDKNREQMGDYVHTWEHFFLHLPRRNTNSLICARSEQGERKGEFRALHDVLLRSLTELNPDAIEATLDLIAQNNLYRGEESKSALLAFKKLQGEFDKIICDPRVEDDFVWNNVVDLPAYVSRIRNTAIGTLLIDLSEGEDLEVAVRKYDSVMAPTNYKRPTALVTQAMVDKAQEKVSELGLDLNRRYATINDINVNNLLFADRSTNTRIISSSPFDDIPIKTSDKIRAEEISIDKFISDILPNISSLEVLVDNAHASNFVSLIAPTNALAAPLFKWDNNFSWSYAGDVTDSLKERVKRAGGNVTGDFCCRLAWFNYDDLDLHMVEGSLRSPPYKIYFPNKGIMSPSGGMLDVDMNAGRGVTREPVENIFYTSTSRMREGNYYLFVHNYTKRESKDVGFEVEIDIKGEIYHFSYNKALRDNEVIAVASFTYNKVNGIKIFDSLATLAKVSKQVWNLNTMTFNKVTAMMLSPNYWRPEQSSGNKHYFFMIENCINPEAARGFYNEFLKEDLTPHRKVIEIVGNKTRVENSSSQLSGLGFSSTKRSTLLAKVKGNITRTLKITF